ncbi:MAG TPA: hypothetical protein VFB21_06000 [Chthonomonadaceae bacterium]|nr:hypothetical protein [Chthonomonadaceae bacterium]
MRPKAFPDAEESADASEFERRVLQSFFEEGRLKQIPMARNKMLVVLRRDLGLSQAPS